MDSVKFNLMIVDDEIIVREGIRHLIKTGNSAYRIVAEASNGKEALEVLKNTRMDIILTDIRMPVMDGLDFIRALKELYPNIKVIILSCHADFSYAREAMVMGAVDYILKTAADTESVFAALGKAAEVIERDSRLNTKIEGFKKQIDMNIEEIKSKFLNDLITGVITKEEEVSGKIEIFALRLSRNNMICAVLDIYNKKELASKYDGKNIKLLEASILSMINEILGEFNIGEVFNNDNLQFVILMSFHNEKSLMTIESKCLRVFNEIKDSMEKFFSIGIFISVSSSCSGFEKIGKIYNEAMSIVKMKFYCSPGVILKFSGTSKCNSIDHAWSERKKILIFSAVEKMDMKACVLLIEETYNEMKSMKMAQEDVMNFTLEIITGCKPFIKTRNIPENNIEYSMSNYEDMTFIDNIDSLISYVNDYVLNVIKIHKTSLTIKYRREVAEAVTYIHLNYCQDLTLAGISAVVKMNANYFSQVFKQETGENLIDYINRIRIEIARECLKYGNDKIYEVAEKVGIPDSKYFCKLFKSMVGISPQKFKKSN